MQEVQVNCGEVIFREGEPSDSVYFVLDGRFLVFRNLNGTEVLLDTLEAGQFFGEMGVLRNLPRSATVRATRRSAVLRIDQGAFLASFGDENSIVLPLMRMLCRRLGKANERIVDEVVREPDCAPAQTESDGALRIRELELWNTGVKLNEVKIIRLLPASEPLERQIGSEGVTIEKLPFRVGRRAGRDEPICEGDPELCLRSDHDQQMSTNHFAIEGHDGRLAVKDLDSHLGTIVNGTRIAKFEERSIAGLTRGPNEIQAGGVESPYRFRVIVERN